MRIGFRLQATVVRAARPFRAHEPTSGEGAAIFGGRFNPIGVPALYTSFSFNTAAKEVRFSLNDDPFTFYFLAVDCENIVDLTDAAVRRRLRISFADLASPDWESQMVRGIEPSSHRVARSLIAKGAAGAIVPSFALGADPEDINLVLWRWVEVNSGRSKEPHAVRVLKRDDLPVTSASWPHKEIG